MKRIIKRILGERLCAFVRYALHTYDRALKPYFQYDLSRFRDYSGTFHCESREAMLAHVIMNYHGIEKGLTMPEFRFGFGKDAVKALIASIEGFIGKFGRQDEQILHAIGVVKEYHAVHQAHRQTSSAAEMCYWKHLDDFCLKYSDVPLARQPSVTCEAFYADRDSPFPLFAKARHTIRDFSNAELPQSKIVEAVKIALTTPTACNRQYCRVHCISSKAVIGRLLELQAGSRGFGHLASKVLLVTSDLEGVFLPRERDDVFTNGGMFLMNLCYALFYEKVAHCVLNWSRLPDEDLAMRKLIQIKPSETVVALIVCGEPKEKFRVAASPRRQLGDILFVH